MTLITEPTRQLTSETKLMTSAYVKMSLSQKIPLLADYHGGKCD